MKLTPTGQTLGATIDGLDLAKELGKEDLDAVINGRTVSSYSTAGMIFGVARYIATMSRNLTLHPGDVIWFGCDGPTVPALQPGDLVEVVNERIGVLANRVIRET